jgi:hypothetical protein
MCLLLAAIALRGLPGMLPAAGMPPNRGRLISGLVFVSLAIFSIGTQVWFQRRMISEFTYDGVTLRFRTLGDGQEQIRPVSEVAEVREWRSKGSMIGYRLRFRDKSKLYLEYSVTNAGALAQLLGAGIG